MIGVGAIEFEAGLEGYAIGQAAFETLLDSISRGVDIIVEKLEHKVIARISNREVFSKNFIESFIITFFGRSVELKKVSERLQLHLKKVGVRKRILYRGKINAGFF